MSYQLQLARIIIERYKERGYRSFTKASLETWSEIQDKLDSFYFYSKRLCPRIVGALRRLGFLALDLRWNENNDQGFFCRGPGALNIQPQGLNRSPWSKPTSSTAEMEPQRRWEDVDTRPWPVGPTRVRPNPGPLRPAPPNDRWGPPSGGVSLVSSRVCQIYLRDKIYFQPEILHLISSFPDNPLQNTNLSKLVEFYQIKPYLYVGV